MGDADGRLTAGVCAQVRLVGYRAVEGRVGCPDLMATLLNQLGLDHERLAYFHNGREETLTDPAVTKARVVEELLA